MPHPPILGFDHSSPFVLRPSRLGGLCLVACMLMLGCGTSGSVGPQAAQADDDVAADTDAPATATPPADEPPTENPFPGRFPAPSLDGGVEWFNTAEPIDLRDLRGKIVLLDFWTYCCINCIHVLPDLKYLEERYPENLVVIGVHAPKFENEHDSENIRQAILRYEIAHPVVNDADMTIGASSTSGVGRRW